MKTIEASYQLSLDRYKIINRITYYKAPAVWIIALVFLLLIAFLTFAVYTDFQRYDYEFTARFFSRSAVSLVAIVFYVYLLWYVLIGRIRKLGKKLKESNLVDAVYNYKFTPEKLACVTTRNGRVISETVSDWDLVPLAYLYKDLILLRLAMGFYFLPADAFKSREDFEEFKTFIKTTIKRIVSRKK